MRDDINRELKNKLRSHRAEWDKEALWADIKPHLPQEEKKRRTVFFWWLLPSVLFLITVFCFFTSENIFPKKHDNVAVEKTQNPLSGNNSSLSEINDETKPEKAEQTVEKEIINAPKPVPNNKIKARKSAANNGLSENEQSVSNAPTLESEKNIILADVFQEIPQKDAQEIKSPKAENPFLELPQYLPLLNFSLERAEQEPGLVIPAELTDGQKLSWVFMQEATAGIGRPFRIMESGDPDISSSLKTKENNEEILEGWNARLLLGAKHRSGFFIKTGFDYTQLNERFSGENLLVEEFQVVSDTAYVANFAGGVYTSDTVTATRSQTRFVTHFNQHRFYNIPLVVGFEKIKGVFGFNLYAGASFNVQYDFSGRFNDLSGDLVSENEIAQSGYFNENVGVSYLAGGQFIYHLNKRLGFSGGVEFQHSPRSVVSGGAGFSQRYDFLNLNLGVRRVF